MSFQKIIIVGNVGSDCELTYTPQGIAVGKFTVAVNKTYKKGGEKVQETTWFRCTLWRERAETASQWIKKGSAILVEGEVSASAYMPRSGDKPAASLEIAVSNWSFVGSKRDDDNSAPTDTGADAADIPF